ncbi:MAG TPA: MFS transporter [Pseudonocardia sp.]|uniref:MFS transporter n=1 Tax=Pseudonocardia sp. TaxID=60912 RepID=UPI002B4AF263|nr:MFS transporter [Pseudonocardia sp.]HLU56322.1 MFS transporter [Pseudonocardia sp.]
MTRSATSTPPLLVALACAGQFLVVLDASVLNVALPTIERALGFAPTGVQWVVNAYGLAFAGFLLLGGRLADTRGLRLALAGGLAVFAGASLVGALAPTPAVLVAARALQGIGAAALAPATLALLTTAVPEGPARLRAIAAWTATGMSGGTAGNLVGGALAELASWRWILLVNVPPAAAAIALALRLLPRPPARPATRLDLPGAATAVLGPAALTYAVVESGRSGWAAPATLAPLGVGLLALAAFAIVETRARDPLFPPRVLRSRALVAGNALVALAAVCLMPMWFFLAFLMRDGLGYTPLQTGLGFLPHTVLGMAVGVAVAPRLVRRFDPRAVVAAGAAVTALGFAWQGLAATALDGGYLDELLGPAVLVSVGGGLLTTPLTAAVTSGVAPDAAGLASGLLNTAKQVGGALGLAALVVVAAGPAGGLAFDVVFAAMAVVAAAVGAGAALLPSPGRAIRSQ